MKYTEPKCCLNEVIILALFLINVIHRPFYILPRWVYFPGILMSVLLSFLS